MSYNEAETRFHLIDPVLRDKGYNDNQRIRLETPAPVEPVGPKGRRRKGPGRTDYLLCVQAGDMPRALPVGVLEAKQEAEDPLACPVAFSLRQARASKPICCFSPKVKPRGKSGTTI